MGRVGVGRRHGGARVHFSRENKAVEYAGQIVDALQTAHGWPSWEQSSAFMALALQTVRREPPPPPRSAGLRLASDFASERAEHQRYHQHQEIYEATLEELFSQKAWQWSVKARRYYYRARRPLGRLRRKLQERDF